MTPDTAPAPDVPVTDTLRAAAINSALAASEAALGLPVASASDPLKERVLQILTVAQRVRLDTRRYSLCWLVYDTLRTVDARPEPAP
jgi:hypothetical protein